MLPDITVFGPYTYLVTEVVFGSVALALLVRAGAVRRAAKTVAALYPIAYVWDWYTLEVGVFDIVARTGVDFLGIPVEEHIFMVVVPALVIGFHETIHGPYGTEAGADTGDEAPAGASGEGGTPATGTAVDPVETTDGGTGATGDPDETTDGTGATDD